MMVSQKSIERRIHLSNRINLCPICGNIYSKHKERCKACNNTKSILISNKRALKLISNLTGRKGKRR